MCVVYSAASVMNQLANLDDQKLQIATTATTTAGKYAHIRIRI